MAILLKKNLVKYKKSTIYYIPLNCFVALKAYNLLNSTLTEDGQTDAMFLLSRDVRCLTQVHPGILALCMVQLQRSIVSNRDPQLIAGDTFPTLEPPDHRCRRASGRTGQDHSVVLNYRRVGRGRVRD